MVECGDDRTVVTELPGTRRAFVDHLTGGPLVGYAMENTLEYDGVTRHLL